MGYSTAMATEPIGPGLDAAEEVEALEEAHDAEDRAPEQGGVAGGRALAGSWSFGPRASASGSTGPFLRVRVPFASVIPYMGRRSRKYAFIAARAKRALSRHLGSGNARV